MGMTSQYLTEETKNQTTDIIKHEKSEHRPDEQTRHAKEKPPVLL